MEVTKEIISRICDLSEDWSSKIALPIGCNLWSEDLLRKGKIKEDDEANERHKEDLSTQAARDYKKVLQNGGSADQYSEEYRNLYVMEILGINES